MSICTPAGHFYPVDPPNLTQPTADSPRIDNQRRLEVVVTNGSSVGGDATAANQELEIAQLQNVNDSLDALEADVDVIRTDTSIIKNKVSTESKQDIGNASLASIDVKLSNPLTVNLPTGAATEDKQDDQITILTQLDNNTAFLPFAATEATLLETNNKLDSVNLQLGSIENETSIHLPAIDTSLSSIDSKTPALGQALAAGSVPVVLTAAQLTTLTPPAAITGFATAANQATEIASLSSIDSKFTTLNAKDFATSAKQDNIISFLNSIDTNTVPISNIDTNTSNILSRLDLPFSSAVTPLESIDIKLTTTNSKLTDIEIDTTSIDGKLTTLNAKDFATSAKQDTGNASLSSIDGKFTTLNAKDFATQTTLASVLSDTTAIRTSTGSADTKLTTTNSTLSTISGKLPTALGQTTMANSLAVTIASNQSALSVDTELPAAGALGDSVSNPTTPMIGAGLMSFGGTNFERVRSGQTSVTSSFTGYVNVLPVAQFVSGPANLTNGQATPLMCTNTRNLLVSDSVSQTFLSNIDTSTNSLAGKFPTQAALGDTDSSSTLVTNIGARNMVFDGTNWVRMKSGVLTLTTNTTGIQNQLAMGRYNSTAPTLSSGDCIVAQLDVNGNLRTNPLDGTGIPLVFRNQGANATLNVKASAGVVYSLHCRNLNATVRYIQLWNSSATATSGSLLLEFPINASSFITIDGSWFTVRGLDFSTGIAFGFSTTSGSYVAGSAADQVTQLLYS